MRRPAGVPLEDWPGGQRRKPPLREDAYIALKRLDEFYRELGRSVASGSRVLDFGCGEKPYYPYFAHAAEYVGVDSCPGPAVDVVLKEGEILPFPDGHFDLSLSSQTLEHVSDPRAVVAELRRVLKPGGRVAVSAPFCFPYHAAPQDYWRFTRSGFETIFKDFAEVEVRPACSYLETMVILFNIYLSHKTRQWPALERVRQALTLAANLTALAFFSRRASRSGCLTSDFILTALKP